MGEQEQKHAGKQWLWQMVCAGTRGAGEFGCAVHLPAENSLWVVRWQKGVLLRKHRHDTPGPTRMVTRAAKVGIQPGGAGDQGACSWPPTLLTSSVGMALVRLGSEQSCS